MPSAILNKRLVIIALCCALIPGCTSTTTRPDSSPTDDWQQTIYSDDGISELSVPDTWQVRPDFGPGAAIRVAETHDAAFLIVNSYLPGEIKHAPISEFSSSYAQVLSESLPESSSDGGQAMVINGAPAHRHVVSGNVGMSRLTYVSTVVQGDNAMHHLIGWADAADYSGDQDVLNRIVASFRESASPRPPKHRVSLDFAWPESLQSAVRLEKKTVKRGKALELTADYLTTVRPSGQDELVISTRVINQDLVAESGESKGDYLSTLLQQITSELPDYVVSRDGVFRRVNNLSDYQQRVQRAVVSNLGSESTEKKSRILALLEPVLSEQFLAAAVIDEWNKRVGDWAGSSYLPGQTYYFSEQYHAPSLGETRFSMLVSREIAGFAPCTGSAARCVKLVVTGTVAGEDFRVAIERFLTQTTGKTIEIKHVSLIKRMEILAEPDTLLPHRLQSSEETTMVTEDTNGETRTSRDTEYTRVTYSYDRYSASR